MLMCTESINLVLSYILSLIIDTLLVCTFPKRTPCTLNMRNMAFKVNLTPSITKKCCHLLASTKERRSATRQIERTSPQTQNHTSPCSGGNDDGATVRDRPKAIQPLLLTNTSTQSRVHPVPLVIAQAARTRPPPSLPSHTQASQARPCP